MRRVLICGGCGARNEDVTVIGAKDQDGGFHPLPIGIFDTEVVN